MGKLMIIGALGVILGFGVKSGLEGHLDRSTSLLQALSKDSYQAGYRHGVEDGEISVLGYASDIIQRSSWQYEAEINRLKDKL